MLYTAWTIDKYNDYRKVRKDIAAIKVLMPGVLDDIATSARSRCTARSASATNCRWPDGARGQHHGIADGPTEVHKVTVARQVLRDYRPSDDLWPTQHLPKRLAAAKEKYAQYLEQAVGNL